MKRLVFVLLALSMTFSALLTACSQASIGDILQNFERYEGKEVTVRGTVGETVWLVVLDEGAFQIGDGSGNIWVITTQPPPQSGNQVSVTGTVQAAFTLGDRSLGKVIMERSRK